MQAICKKIQLIPRDKLAGPQPGKHWEHTWKHKQWWVEARQQEEGVAAMLWQHPGQCCLWWTEKVEPIRLLSPS